VRVLVTGGAGFIASHIADLYIKEGHRVSIVDNLSSGRRSNINSKAEFYKLDITSSKIKEIFKRGRFDIVNHHAAQIDVRKSVTDPSFDAGTNIMGTLNLLQNAVQSGVKRFVFASSGGVMYGECPRPPSETKPALPISPYGISKKAVEDYLRFFRFAHGLESVIFRYGNVYGPRQDPHGEAGVVAIFSRAMLENRELYIFGDGKQVRDYVYVGDVARANLIALKKGEGEIFNIGTERSLSVNQLYGYLKKITGYKKPAVYKQARLGELQSSKLNAGKSRKRLGWRSQVDIVEGLSRTAAFFKG